MRRKDLLPEVDRLAELGVELPGEALRDFVDARAGRPRAAVRGGPVHLGCTRAAAPADGEDDLVECGALLSSVPDPNL